jgi:hypothetical protein
MKNFSVAAESFHLDGWVDARPDMTQLTVAFRNFAKAPNEHKKRKSKKFPNSYNNDNNNNLFLYLIMHGISSLRSS